MLMQIRPATGLFVSDEYTVALWHFNEGTGQTTYDMSPHHNDGMLGSTSNVEASDPSWTTGFTGQPGDWALSFDGIDDYVVVPGDSSWKTPEFTCEFSFKSDMPLDTYLPDHVCFITLLPPDYPYPAYPHRGYNLIYNYAIGGLSLTIGDGSYPWNKVNYATTFNADQWYHIAATFNGTTGKLYIDGAEVASGPSNPVGWPPGDITYEMRIGRGEGQLQRHFDGVMDEVRISNIARVPPVEATVNVDPYTLNLVSNGQWISAFITPPEGYTAEDIDILTIRLKHNDFVLTADWGEIQDSFVMSKFDRVALRDYLGEADIDEGDKFYDITLIITGKAAEHHLKAPTQSQ